MVVHPGESNCCVVVRKQASIPIVWMYIQATLSVVWMYIQASLNVVWCKKAGESTCCVDVHPGVSSSSVVYIQATLAVFG